MKLNMNIRANKVEPPIAISIMNFEFLQDNKEQSVFSFFPIKQNNLTFQKSQKKLDLSNFKIQQRSQLIDP